jgi:aryl-alcohol dehydrogenase-like predicted oxidoreductase
MPIVGYATPQGTSRFRERHANLSQTFKPLGKTGLVCSPVGFGSYRIDVRVKEHQAALAKALRMGVNLIDSSANYADGNSERLIGETLKLLIDLEEISRDEIIVVTKGGYIQGENYERVSQRVKALDNEPPPRGSELAEVVKYANSLWHSIHPDFLADQITRSLERLDLDTIDAYLLHNPEYFLQWAVKDNMPEEEAREMYEDRIVRAFEHLEREVEDGRIRSYGISSNTFGKPEEAVDRTALEQILRHLKDRRGEEHHFAVIQLPMNLYERGGIVEANQEKATTSVISYSRNNGIGVLINRPLNAIVGNRLVRLANYPEREFPPLEDINDLVHDAKIQEDAFKEQVLNTLELNPQAKDAVGKLLGFGAWLENKWHGLATLDEWRDLVYTVIRPRLQYAFDLLQKSSHEDEILFKFLQEYAETIDETIEHITNFYTSRSASVSTAIHEVVDELLPSRTHELSLSQKAILALRSIEGVSCVLIGMRSEEYVEDVIFGLQAEVLEHPEDFWKQLNLS